MSTVEAFQRILAPLITASKVVGIEIWTSDKLLQPTSYVIIAHFAAYNVCNVYTVVRNASDPIKLMQITLLFGLATQLMFKYFDVLAKKQSIRQVFALIEENIYRRYSDGTREEKTIVEKTTRYLEIIWKMIYAIYQSTLFVFAMWPIYVYLAEGQVIPLFMYEIPGVDPEQPVGYVLTLLCQVDLYMLGLIGLFLADYLFVFMCLQALSMMDLFVLHLKMLGKLLTEDRHEKDLEAISDKWKECMRDNQFVTGFLNEIEDISSLGCLVLVFSCIYTIGDAMLLVTLNNYYAALFFLFALAFVITINFIIGNTIEVKIEEMYVALTALPWNLLSVSQQKEFGFVLARTQRPLNLTCYGFAPYNFETYTTLVKNLYQFFILVLQYLK